MEITEWGEGEAHWMGSMADGDARTKSVNLRTEQGYSPNLNKNLT